MGGKEGEGGKEEREREKGKRKKDKGDKLHVSCMESEGGNFNFCQGFVRAGITPHPREIMMS